MNLPFWGPDSQKVLMLTLQVDPAAEHQLYLRFSSNICKNTESSMEDTFANMYLLCG